MSSQDILFLNATIIDGTGKEPRFLGSLLVRDKFIKTIKHGSSPFSEQEMQSFQQGNVRIIDCEQGRWTLTPGFIDMHAHSDLSLLHTPAHEAKITQGVTTEVIGQDGISYSPVNDSTMERIRHQIAGWNGNPSEPADFFDRWRTVGEYLDVLDREKVATNVAYLVPQGNLRTLVKGWDSSPATEDELEKMKTLLRKSLEEGAVGMSSGLTYVPGMFADTDELIELCRVVKEYDGYYCPHTRSYGRGAMEAYAEMIEIARETGVRLHLTHAVLNFEENAGKADEFLAMIDAANTSGLEVSLDSYPYLPGSTTLASTLPSWISSAPDDQKRSIISSPDHLPKLRQELLETGTDGHHGLPLDFSKIEISGVSDPSLSPLYVGKTISQISAESGEPDPIKTYIQILLADDFSSTILLHVGHEPDLRRILRHPTHTGSTDGILTSTKPHPRGWGTFPRYLGHYARDLPMGRERDIHHPSSTEVYEDVTPETVFAGGLEEAVTHLTSRAAKVVGMRDRGVIGEGMRGDLVLFDPEKVRDSATFAKPEERAEGIGVVLVNGGVAMDFGGRVTGWRGGRTIRGRREG